MNPVLVWDDSIYLQIPRLGKVEDYAANGRVYHWIYEDMALYELNSEWRWCTGIKHLTADECSKVDALLEDYSVEEEESPDLEELTSYWFCDSMYDAQNFRGPWVEITRLLGNLEPDYTVDVRDERTGAGLVAVHGSLKCAQGAGFISVSGDTRIQGPSLSGDVVSYLRELIESRFAPLGELTLSGILYYTDEEPQFFYVLEGY